MVVYLRYHLSSRVGYAWIGYLRPRTVVGPAEPYSEVEVVVREKIMANEVVES